MSRRNPVRLHSNGSYWTAAWRDPFGRLHRRSLGTKKETTRNAALAACQEIALSELSASRDKTIATWGKEYLTLNRHLAPATLVRYQAAIQWMGRYYGADLDLHKIAENSADEFVAWLREQHKNNDPSQPVLSPATVWGIVAAVKWFLQRAVERKIIGSNPFDRVRNPKLDLAKEKPYVSEKRADDAIASAPDQSWKCFIALARYGGLRASEAMALQLGHIDWNRRVLTVWPRQRVTTTKQKRRIVPICPKLYDILRAGADAVPEGQDRICWTVQRDSYVNSIRRLIAKSGEPWTPPMHSLRASLETDWMKKHPAPAVCEWLGHDPKIAQTHYVMSDRFLGGVTGLEAKGTSDEGLNSKPIPVASQPAGL